MEEYKRAQAVEHTKGAAAYADFLCTAALACEARDVDLLKVHRDLTLTLNLTCSRRAVIYARPCRVWVGCGWGVGEIAVR